MKKMFKSFIVALTFALIACSFAGCTSSGAPSAVEVSDPIYGFIEADKYIPNTTTMEDATNGTRLQVDTEYFAMIEFDVTSHSDNDGQSLLNVVITFDNLDAMDGTMEEVSTGIVTELTVTDAPTGKNIKTTDLRFKVPSRSSKPKKIGIVVRLKPLNVEESHIKFTFEAEKNADNVEMFDITGSSGFTRNIKIEQVQLETPEMRYEESYRVLYIKNVKNADYYCLYEAATSDPLKDINGNVIYIRSEDFGVGSEIPYPVSNLTPGLHLLQVRAFNNNERNIAPSDFSEVLSIQVG